MDLKVLYLKFPHLQCFCYEIFSFSLFLTPKLIAIIISLTLFFFLVYAYTYIYHFLSSLLLPASHPITFGYTFLFKISFPISFSKYLYKVYSHSVRLKNVSIHFYSSIIGKVESSSLALMFPHHFEDIIALTVGFYCCY